MTNYSTDLLRDFSSLFTRSEVNKWFDGNFQSIDTKLQRYHLEKKYKGQSYIHIIRQTYKILEQHYPNEYILKNEFLTQWLKNELGTNQSVIFNELRLGKAIADLAMFNGASKAFEIKTILDKEYRLSNQLSEYKKLFNEVYIIIPIELLDKYFEFDHDVGVISYDAQFKLFKRERQSFFNNKIDTNVLMEVLHTKEYIDIVNTYYQDIPEMNSFNQFVICKELISKIPQEKINDLFISKIKERKINNKFFNIINREFNQISLSLNLDKEERDRLIRQLRINKV